MKYILPVTLAFLCFHTVIGLDDSVSDVDTNDAEADSQLYRVRRGGLSMLRLGRGLQMLRLGKRALPMLRLGRSTGEDLSSGDVNYLLDMLLRHQYTRQVPLPRYGKDLDKRQTLADLSYEDIVDLLRSLRPGYTYDLDTSPERQIRPAPRPGIVRYRRSADQSPTEGQSVSTYDEDHDQNKRAAPVPRIGKESGEEDGEDYDEEVIKRAMHMLRLGRGMRMLRLGKRAMHMLRLGRSDGEVDAETDDDSDLTEVEKRALRLLRLGKRPFKMLRLGRAEEEDKRALRLLRLGKKDTAEESKSS
ncbi:hypothetical protein ACJMK2_019836 [Sinanodonta woodiana]|uniref:Uncharacterized protein n=1 Tax=Sinanodonta woodiana TaxID=1069815 RepID=A0ABD3TX84_SINWO